MSAMKDKECLKSSQSNQHYLQFGQSVASFIWEKNVKNVFIFLSARKSCFLKSKRIEKKKQALFYCLWCSKPYKENLWKDECLKSMTRNIIQFIWNVAACRHRVQRLFPLVKISFKGGNSLPLKIQILAAAPTKIVHYLQGKIIWN